MPVKHGQETAIGRLKLETTLGKLVRPCLKKEHKIKPKGKFISVKFIRLGTALIMGFY